MDIKAFQSQFLGDILTPDSTEYEASRRIWSGMIDRRPAAIARCSGPEDVRAAVRFAVDQEIYPAIRAGGHNVAGLAMVDDGPDTHEGHLCRSGTPHGDRSNRSNVGRIRPRDTIVRARDDVISGMILHPIAQAREVLEFYRDFVVSGLPAELTALSNGGSPQSQ